MLKTPWRLRRRCALWLALVAAAGCADKARFAGIWKVSCDDYWGVRIRPAGAGRYSVTFCGLSGCLPPGTWMPDTRIEGDPLYEIESATRIRIKRQDPGYFTYTRCSVDPVWKAGAP